MAKAKYRIEGENATGAAFRAVLGDAQSTANKLKGIFTTALAGVSVAAIANLGKQAINLGDQLDKARIKAGLTGKEMSELAYAGDLAGVELASLSTAFNKMNKAVSEAGSGLKAQKDAIEALGLSVEQLEALSPAQRFELIAEQISKVENQTDKVRAAMDLFGRAGADLLPLFEQGAAGIRMAREEAEKLGYSFSDETLNRMVVANDSISRLGKAWDVFAVNLTSKVAPALSDILDMLSGVDSRSLAQQIDDEIKALDEAIGQRNFGMGGGVGGRSAEAEAALRLKREQMIARRELLNSPSLTEAGGGRGRSLGRPLGYLAQTDDKAAKEAARALKEEEKLAEQRLALLDRLESDATDLIWSTYEEYQEAKLEEEKSFREAMEESAKELEEWRAEQDEKLKESQKILKDGFMSAWEDWIHTGKLKIDELFKYLVLEFTRLQIGKLFDSMFSGNGSSSSGSSGGTDYGMIFTGIRSIFGYANGGRPPAGVPYMVGEAGPEVRIDGPGTIFPNHALGGAMTFAPVYHIDARGATTDLVRALPQILERNNRALKAEFAEELRRRRHRI